ncbi:NADP-dependent oxidoreductase [Actinomadura rupiterrae]|uniref:NADP-dependent oxidoreductase n=1 Tax=Actinomadura rupiterrae TaxID=559627 RepID=UPI0027E2B125|nr:NADP-dependent oxidoreductase [Actinomadura rupiterrae]MCP2335850.1 NADPH-dependent curcumin reductase CurA [Actinomadura rupiterrae]
MREIRLVARAVGLPRPENFEVVDVPVPEGDGVLVRNAVFHVFPGLRVLVGDGEGETPWPRLSAGDPLMGAAVGEVVSAPDGASVRPGDLVSHFLGWREYALVPEGQLVRLDGELPDPAAYLAPGVTAYSALTREAPVRPGETVLVTGAAGGVGSLAGQIARLLGAGRVVGTTGSAQKGERLVAEFGYDAALSREEASTAEGLRKVAPDGIDVVVDNVGGAQLRAAVGALNQDGRVALVGTLSSQLAPGGSGASAPVELDVFELIRKRVSLRGVLAQDAETRAEWTRRFGGWLREREIAFPHVRFQGIESAPRALHELLAGEHLGSVVVDV